MTPSEELDQKRFERDTKDNEIRLALEQKSNRAYRVVDYARALAYLAVAVFVFVMTGKVL